MRVRVLTCPRAYNVSAGRLRHCVRQPLLQALFRGFHRGHVTQSETLRPAATHLQQGDAAVKHACQRKTTDNNSSNHHFDSHCIKAPYKLSLQTAFFLSFIIVAYHICMISMMMIAELLKKNTILAWNQFIKSEVIIHNEPEKCLWPCGVTRRS